MLVSACGWRRVAAVTMGVVLGAAVLVGCGAGTTGPIVLHFETNDEGADASRTAAAECSKASGGRYLIEQRSVPGEGTDGQRLNIVRRLAAHDPSLDVMELDVIWTAELAEAGWLLPYPSELARSIRQGTLKIPLETGTYHGKLYAAPLAAGVQLLWYRKDLVSTPPETWDEMIQMAEELAARGLPHYIEVQGARYEGLMVWFNTLLTSGGGSILAENGAVQVAQGNAARQALGIMARLATSPAADPSLSVSQEEDGRLAMEAGTAAFELNYPFAYATMHTPGGGGTFIDEQGRPTSQDTGRRVKDVFGWARYPSVVPGRPASVTIGGINLAVSAYSRHPAEAFEAVQCLRNRDNQLRHAVAVQRSPTLAALYDDPEFQKESPAWQAIRDSLDHASKRPATPAYKSLAIVTADLLNPAAGIDPDTVVRQLADQVAQSVTSQVLVP